MTEIEVKLALGERTLVVGRLLDDERAIHFEYDAGFLATRLELSPRKLPLKPGVFSDGLPEFHGLYGVFHDALPDGWGLLLMHRRMRAAGIDPERISVLRWLTHLGERGMGALTFHPIEGGPEPTAVELDLRALEAEAQRVYAGKAKKVLPLLELAGGSPGGARPKVVIALGPGDTVVAGAGEVPRGFEHWLVKFTAKPDPADMGPLEEAYALMARAAGVEVAETRLFDLGRRRRVFASKRFDRVKGRRLHLHTIGGLLHASHRLPSLDYQQVVAATLWLTKDRSQGLEAFRRAAFNVLAGNRDDHAHNISFLMDERGTWRLSPAYDLTPSAGPGGSHCSSVMGEARQPTRQHLLALARHHDFAAARAREILDEVEHAVAHFSRFAMRAGVSATTTRRIERRLKELRAAAAR